MPRFVIQQHHATSMHYDFRLEVADGVLVAGRCRRARRSTRADKRLAHAVEDHRHRVGDFEGVIPKGEYGAGPVIVWDRGTYENLREEPMEDALAAGHASFRLEGEKLQGGWSLRQIGAALAAREAARRRGRRPRPCGRAARVGRQRTNDRGARRVIEPMKAVLSDQPFSDPAWIFERKLDGIRCIAIKDGSGVSLMSRTAHRMNDQFGEVAEALEREPAEDFVLDGELVAFRDGVTSFELLQQRHRRHVRGVQYYVFDLPRLNGEDLRRLPLRERKARLRRALRFDGTIRFNPHRNGEHGEELYREACRKGLEGVIAKRADSPYTGEALARLAEAEVPRGAGARDRRLHGSEGVAYRLPGAAGGLQREAARSATPARSAPASTRRTLGELGARLRELEQDESPFPPFKPVPPGTRWVRPELVAQVAFSEWTRDGRLRHPRFLGLREDKPARDVVREVPS